MRRWLGLLVAAVVLAVAGTAMAQEPTGGEATLPDTTGTETTPLDQIDPLGPGALNEGIETEGDQEIEAQATGDPMPFGHPCEELEDEGGIRFCPTTTDADRVPSFDKVPLDVDVTLPAEGDGPFPTIVMMHGYGGSKEDFETQDDGGEEGDGNILYHYNNVYYAKRGYAVVNYSTRGFGNSCGRETEKLAAADPNCDDGYIHLADQRFEVRDTQHLLGLLEAGDPEVDEDDNQEITDADRIGVTGISYGGGQSTMLALLNDRIADCDRGDAKPGRSNCDPITSDRPNRDLKRWKSADGTDMSIAAAFPRWPWTDLVASLLPNGRFRDFERADADESRDPIGIPIQSFLAGLFASGKVTGYYCGDGPPGPSGACDDIPNSALNEDNARIQAGEPYTDAFTKQIANEIYHHHGASGLFKVADPAPLLLENGWTDDLFPPREALRIYNELRDGDSNADVSVLFGDLGHQRGSNKENTNRDFNDRGSDFFDSRIEGEGDGPDEGSAAVWTQTCPQDAPADGPFEAESWPEIQQGEATFGSDTTQTVTSGGGDSAVESGIDPIGGGGDACRTFKDQQSTESNPNTAVYRGEPSDSDERMIGLPTVCADIRTIGQFGQLDSRLWDVDPTTGDQILVSRGAYRLTANQTGEVTFQLQGNAWTFEEGHVPKLELLGRDADYLRPSNDGFAVEVSDLRIDFPGVDGGCADAAADGGSNDRDDDEDRGSSGGGNRGGGNNGNNGGNDSTGLAPTVLAGSLGAAECAFFGQNFSGLENMGALRRCVAATVNALTLGATPGLSCRQQGLSARRRRGDRRSDLRACILAVTSAGERRTLLGL